MQRFRQLLFLLAVIASCWLLMMAVHELGHIFGALLTGGTVKKVVLHPLAISRTDVSPNPHPAIVVWLGPLVGCLPPWLLSKAIRPREGLLHNISAFFSGFCFIANGSYIGIGTFGKIGDCHEMMRTGTPDWVMLTFAAVAISAGFRQWHYLGSPTKFLARPESVTAAHTCFACAIFIALVLISLVLH